MRPACDRYASHSVSPAGFKKVQKTFEESAPQSTCGFFAKPQVDAGLPFRRIWRRVLLRKRRGQGTNSPDGRSGRGSRFRPKTANPSRTAKRDGCDRAPPEPWWPSDSRQEPDSTKPVDVSEATVLSGDGLLKAHCGNHRGENIRMVLTTASEHELHLFKPGSSETPRSGHLWPGSRKVDGLPATATIQEDEMPAPTTQGRNGPAGKRWSYGTERCC